MAYLQLSLLFALSFVALSSQQDSIRDPIKEFCRRWGHQTAQIGSKLYIDGGMVTNQALTSNYTNTWLLFSDLETSTGDAAMPAQNASLSKPGNIPSVSGGYIWADETNKCFYQFGGEYPEGASPTEFIMWTYDVLLNQWNETETNGEKSPQRVSYGAGTEVEERGLGFYFGGWLSNRTTPGWKGPRMATSGLMRLDYSTGNLRNISGPDDTGRAEGELFFLPVSDGGMLVYFGGIEDPYHNGSSVAADMNDIHIYDIASSKWYTQTASGDTPKSRRQFCADVTWPEDRSSFNIYLYGGYGFDTPAFDEVYILSLPSFKWIKAYPSGDSSDAQANAVGHGGCSANALNRAQMLVIGGSFPTYDKCDSEGSQGQHNMVMGYNGGDKKLWDKYDPKLSTYVVPAVITSAIGGGPTGGATVTAPATWGHADLATYYILSPSFSARTATRAIPSASSTSSAGSGKTNIGAIAGGTVGGLVALIAILSLILFCLHRRKKSIKRDPVPNGPAPPPPAELAETTFPHEMPTPDANKYVSNHVHPYSDDGTTYSGMVQPHSRSLSHDYNSPYPAQMPPSYGSAAPFPTATYNSPTEGGHVQHSPRQRTNGELFYPDNGAGYNMTPTTSWDQQVDISQPTAASQHQYSYPAPTSPRQSPNVSTQQQPQLYYPPSTEPTNLSPHSLSSFPHQQRGTPPGRQYNGEGQHHDSPNTSTITTPAQFYAQPVPSSSSRMHDGDEHYYADRRPVQGRFMEDGQM